MMNGSQTLLLVEDDDDEAALTLRAFKDANISNPMVRVEDGELALDYLFRRGAYASRPANDEPALILLDLRLPRLGGVEVLAALRADERTRHLPVVVLTASTAPADRDAAYANQANSYVQKPVDHERFVEAVRQLGRYWLVLNVPAPPLAQLTPRHG
jgi:CheY-like chemotaxis protein